MMLSRREFLRQSFLFGLGAALAACAPSPPSQSLPQPSGEAPTATPVPTPVPPTATALPPTATLRATATATRVVPPTAGQAYLALARGENPAAITRAAIDALGGIKRFVQAGDEVIIKPNICTASMPIELAATTNPEVVGALVALCVQAGAQRVRVMDQPFSGTATQAYKTSGIRDAVERAGGHMEVMAAMKYAAANFGAPARDLKSWKVYQDVLKADVLISVPVAKSHNLARVTLGMKGLMGVILDREDFHPALHQRVADLNALVKTTLTVIDGVRVVMKGGPVNWNPDSVAKMNTVIASHDVVAADAYAVQTLFKWKPEEIGHIQLGAEMGLGRYDFKNLSVKEVSV